MTLSPLALAQALRPRQWLKNVLVFAAPLAGGVLLDPPSLVAAVIAFVVFCASASGVYLVNDCLDIAGDRLHPRKRNRPIASGRVSVPSALIAAGVLFASALAGGWLLLSPAFLIVVASYILIQLSYCLWLKHVVVLDVIVVASGFLLRAIAGAVAVGVVTSEWFLLVTAFGSLFMVGGKRYAEKLRHEEDGARTRKNLEAYTSSYLRFVWGTSAALVLISYALWAFSLDGPTGMLLPALSVVPFTVAILRYAFDVDRGAAGAPEDTVLADPTLLIAGASWLAVFALFVAIR